MLAMMILIYLDSENSSEICLALCAWKFARITADKLIATIMATIVIDGVVQLFQHVPNEYVSLIWILSYVGGSTIVQINSNSTFDVQAYLLRATLVIFHAGKTAS